ncbi:hypothetical protein SAMN05443665_1027105 [Actinomadura meyerae]|uniref:Uncharacterized protein n=1 Tax=Actinomadura meyerae TaxID=240840 RepID=A0A239MDN9_9ACTN|nr:hypothetical protein [Actinomadura meyerae]SNT40855.1 hypothetical protein SAMN05443665_1027105 [Actinomadura meyerae]
MQCPTCGNDTPGTLGKCSHCAAPIDVYSVGPAAPLAAPVADQAPGAGAADGLGDRTMMVPPPTPSWAPEPQPAGLPDFPTPQNGSPQAATPPAGSPYAEPAEAGYAQAGYAQGGSPQAGHAQAGHAQAGHAQAGSAQAGYAQAGPGFGGPQSTSPEPPAGAAGASSAAPASGPADPEDTAAWTFNPEDDDSGSYGTVPPPPAWGAGAGQSGQPALPASEKPALPSGGANPFGLADAPEPTESIVPESWFAQPRKPQEPDADATQVWGGQAAAAQPPAMPDADATQLAPGPMQSAPMNPGFQGGFGGDFDQTRLDGGSPMGAAPMGQMGQMGPMGQPGMGQPGMGQPGMGQPGMAPMGGMGPGGPEYGGYPSQQPGGSKGGGPSKPLIAAVAALVTVAVGAVVFVVWPSGDNSSASTTPTSTPSSKQVAQKNAIPPETKQQAAELNGILDDSVATRRVLAGALGRAGKCKTLPQAIQGFQQVAQRRQNQLGRTKSLKVDKLANGERLRGSLSEALDASLQVDLVLLRWAQANQRKCHGKPKPSAAHVPGRAAQERRATAAKKKFVVLWNPVAKKTGQPQRSWLRV